MVQEMKSLPKPNYKKLLLIFSGLITLLFVTTFLLLGNKPNRVDYNADVKPILNKKCISCHGGVKKKGGFSLLFEEEALASTESGKPAIIPFHADSSEFIKRLFAHDIEERMPYHEEPLPENEIQILRQWINEGAKFDTHWAYKPIENPSIPSAGFFSFFQEHKSNDIDAFVDEKLDQVGLHRSEQADKETLLRRVSLDLIGMPANDNISTRYLSENSDKSWDLLVDSLLSSPSYGEKWAGMWMDIARYADTKGYERDGGRSIWRYRDWLIKSFNQDMPYSQFLTEQIAGDLLPNASDDQLLATAFHRNTMTNDEGGTDNEEFRTAAIIDRVNTTWQTLLGTSFACVQCHSHPYDPFRHEEYYSFMAYFNNSRDEDTYSDYPLLREFKNNSKLQYDSLMYWLSSNTDKQNIHYYQTMLKTAQPTINSLVADSMINAALADTKFLAMRKTSWARIRTVNLSGKKNLLIRYRAGIKNGKLNIHLNNTKNKPFILIDIPESRGWNIISIPLKEMNGVNDLVFHYENSLLKSKDETGINFDWFALSDSFPGKNDSKRNYYQDMYFSLLNHPDATFTPIMMDNPSEMYRKTNVFERGNWLLKTKEVYAGIPALFNPDKNLEKNRIGLAKWLVDKRNPLTARTMVNRVWEQLFGQGLVETLEDLGSQGATPTHRELLDHLSYKFMNDFQWSVKKLLSYIVHSSTYKQSANTSKKMLEKDPLNKYYARSPRVRLSAEQIRDQALFISGKLNSTMYGPSVMPYQPEGIWASPYDGEKWIQSQDENIYRRALYTYWKRTSPYPSMVNFDGSAREVCVARRIRTNTPLQALTILNDSTYWDLSFQCAKKIYTKNNAQKLIAQTYKRATGKNIPNDALKTLSDLYNKTFARLSKEPRMTYDLISMKANTENNSIAALTVVINTILNLDEVITKS